MTAPVQHPPGGRGSRPAWGYLLALLVAGAGCADAGAAPAFEVLIAVESDPGVALAGATVHQGDAHLGTSDGQGHVALALTGQAGAIIPLQVQCPKGYRAPAKPIEVVLRRLAEPGKRPRYRALCTPELRSLVVAVRAERGPRLPVRYRDQVVATTDASGVAHVQLQVPPEETVTLVLDTSGAEHGRLMPSSPEFSIVMPERDHVAVFEQTFAIKRSPKGHKRRAVGDRPQRITTRR